MLILRLASLCDQCEVTITQQTCAHIRSRACVLRTLPRKRRLDAMVLIVDNSLFFLGQLQPNLLLRYSGLNLLRNIVLPKLLGKYIIDQYADIANKNFSH